MTTVIATRAASRRTARPRRRIDVDWALVAGGLFFGALVLLAIYGPLIAPHDVYFSQSVVNGKAAPFPPSPEYPFGSDTIGRDRFSWLLIAARGSVAIAFAAAALRVLIGASLGLVAGFSGGALGDVLRRIALGVSSVPAMIATLLAVIALDVRAEYFVLALGLIGWAEPFHQARRYSRSETARPFMESARSLGVSQRRLVLRHLLPNVAPQLLTTAAFQVSAVLLLMAELALLNIFVGGSVVVDYDARGNAIVAPRVPNWASMLAATRPIVSLYGDLASVLLPGGALLASVVAINLFGDALAARAQRLDVFRLFSRRQVLVAAAVTVLVALSVNLWPSRLSAEFEYARGFDAVGADAVAHEIAALGPLRNASPAAAAAATLLADRTDGQLLTGTDTATQVRDSELRIAGALIPRDSVTMLSIADLSTRGPLIYADARTLLLSRPMPPVIRGAVVVVPPSPIPILGLLPRLATEGAVALIALDLSVVGFPKDPILYPIPTATMTTAAMISAVRRPLPDLRMLPLHWVALADEASVRVTTEQVVTPITDVIARVPGSQSDAPLVVIASAYDGAPGTAEIWGSAAANGVVVAALDHLRRTPLDIEVVAIFTSGDYQSYAGLRRGLASLEPQQRARFQALLLVGPIASGELTLRTEVTPGITSGTGRLAARLKDATGIALDSDAGGELQRALFAAGFATTPIAVSAEGPEGAPGVATLERAGRTLLAALAYVPRHQSEMH